MEKTNQNPRYNNIIKLPKQFADLWSDVDQLKKELTQTLGYLLIDTDLNTSLAKVIQSLSIKKKWPFALKYAYKSTELQEKGALKITDTLAGLRISDILKLLSLKEQKEFLKGLTVELLEDYNATQDKLHQSLKKSIKKLEGEEKL